MNEALHHYETTARGSSGNLSIRARPSGDTPIPDTNASYAGRNSERNDNDTTDGGIERPTDTNLVALSGPLQKLVAYGADAFGSIATFLRNTPEIYREDTGQLQSLILNCLRRKKNVDAYRIAQRLILLTHARADPADALQWLEKLARSSTARNDLDKDVLKVLKQFEAQIDQGSDREFTTTRARLQTSPSSGDNVLEPTVSSSRHERTINTSTDERVSSQQESRHLAHGRRTRDNVQKQVDDEQHPAQPSARSSTTTRRTSFRTLPSDWDNASQGPDIGGGLMRMGNNIEKKLPQDVQKRLRSDFKEFIGQKALDEVFSVGCLFAIFWHDSLGNDLANQLADRTAEKKPKPKPGTFFTKVDNGDWVFSHDRRFLVVKKRKGFCLALPITSYSGRGLSRKSVHDPEYMAHCIIHDDRYDPQLMDNEMPFVKDPVPVKMYGSETLTVSSRLCYAKPTPIEFNTKVKKIGRIVNPRVIAQVLVDFRRENLD